MDSEKAHAGERGEERSPEHREPLPEKNRSKPRDVVHFTPPSFFVIIAKMDSIGKALQVLDLSGGVKEFTLPGNASSGYNPPTIPSKNGKEIVRSVRAASPRRCFARPALSDEVRACRMFPGFSACRGTVRDGVERGGKVL